MILTLFLYAKHLAILRAPCRQNLRQLLFHLICRIAGTLFWSIQF